MTSRESGVEQMDKFAFRIDISITHCNKLESQINRIASIFCFLWTKQIYYNLFLTQFKN